MLYSAHKAELEATLMETVATTPVQAYVLRPCIVAGPVSLDLITRLPYVWAANVLPPAFRRALGSLRLSPVLPDFGIPFQLVHGDDVASALVAAVIGRGDPGVYNLAGSGQVAIVDLAGALRWHSIWLPSAVLDAVAESATRFPFGGERLDWLHALRTSVVVDSGKARRLLGWQPQHDAQQTLHQTVVEASRRGLTGTRFDKHTRRDWRGATSAEPVPHRMIDSCDS